MKPSLREEGKMKPVDGYSYVLQRREKGSTKWETVNVCVDELGLWKQLCPILHSWIWLSIDRVRIYKIGNDERTDVVLFEGSYPAVLLWVMGIWNNLIPSKRRHLEEKLLEAFCIKAGECKEKDDEETNHVD